MKQNLSFFRNLSTGKRCVPSSRKAGVNTWKHEVCQKELHCQRHLPRACQDYLAKLRPLWDRMATQRSTCDEDAASGSTASNQESAAPDAETRRFRKLYPSSAVQWKLRNGHGNHGYGAKLGGMICLRHQ